MAVRFDADAEDYTRALSAGTQTIWTMACWGKITTDRNTFSTFMCCDDGTTSNAFMLQTATDGTQLTYFTDSGSTNGPTLTVGTWYYMAVSVSSGAGTLYTRALNATSTTATAITATKSTLSVTNLRLGESIFTTEWLNGCVTGCKLWLGAALTQQEIEREMWQHMPARTVNLRAWYPLLKAETTDYSGLGQTLSGGAAATTEDGPGISWSGMALPRIILPPSGVQEAGTTAYTTANATTVTTASFTPADNTLLVAYAGMGNGTGGAVSLGAVTDSLGGSWTRLGSDVATNGGIGEIWARNIATGASMTVTYDPGGAGASGLGLACKWYTNAEPVAGQTGATATLGGATAYTKAITTTTTGSLVAGSFGRASDAVTLVANASTTIIGQVNGSAGDTQAAFRATANTGTPGSTTLGFTNSPAGLNFMTLVELLPASGSVHATATPATVAGAAAITGTAQAGSAPAPATISRTVVISGTAQAGSAPTLATVSGAAVISGTASGAATATPATVAGSVVISGTARMHVAVAPAAVAPVAVVISGTASVSGGATTTPATVVGTAVLSGAAQVGSTLVVSTVSGAVVLSGAAQAGSVALPATIAPPAVVISGAVDQPPSVPTGLAAVAVRSNEADLTWNASTDDAGVVRYEIVVTQTA